MIWPLLLFVLVGGGAVAGGERLSPPGDCEDDRGVDRCDQRQQARVRALFGVKPIEDHLRAGDQVRRAFYVDGYGSDELAIEFIRSPGSDPKVIIYYPRRDHASQRPPMEALVPLTAWEEVIEASTNFDSILASAEPAPKSTRKEEPEEFTLCMHSWVYTVEAVDRAHDSFAPIIRRRTEDACDDGLTEAFANKIMKAAVPLFPHCALLDRKWFRNEVVLLKSCFALSGDRAAAAEVFNRAEAFGSMDSTQPGDGLTRLISHDFVLDFQGVKTTGTDGQKAWQAQMADIAGVGFFYDKIRGIDARNVVVTAFLVKWAENEKPEVADVEMRWEREGDWFDLKSTNVGPFRPWTRPNN